MPTAQEIATFLDEFLDSGTFQDYDRALNGLQLDHGGPVRRVATAVDYSRRTIDAAVERGANLLVLHHGMFWNGLQRMVGPSYRRFEALRAHDIAVYASHLPLDAHPTIGNCVLLAREMGLTPSARFDTHHGVDIGWSGTCALPTAELLGRATVFAQKHGGFARASAFPAGRTSHRWAVVTGAGVGSRQIQDAAEQGIDTLLVGEGPHHTTVDAPEYGLAVIYAGHYATETLGVSSLAPMITRAFDVPCEFLHLPTGS